MRQMPHRPGRFPPTKKPAARHARQVSVVDAGGIRIGIRLKDGSPASTLPCGRWNGLSYRRLLRCACSRASAGNVCWAKPNHAFFRCQQSFAKFFFDAPITRARIACIAASAGTQRMRVMTRPTRSASPARKQRRGPQHSDAIRTQCDAPHSRKTSSHANDARHRCASADRRPSHFASHKCVCAKTARTFPRASRLHERSRTPARHAGCVQAGWSTTHAGKEKPAAFPLRVPDRSGAEAISVLRFPAVRRRHRDRATR